MGAFTFSQTHTTPHTQFCVCFHIGRRRQGTLGRQDAALYKIGRATPVVCALLRFMAEARDQVGFLLCPVASLHDELWRDMDRTQHHSRQVAQFPTYCTLMYLQPRRDHTPLPLSAARRRAAEAVEAAAHSGARPPELRCGHTATPRRMQ